MRTTSKGTRIFAAVATLLAGMTAAAPAAQASEAETRPLPHCTMYISAGTVDCYATFHEAIANATGGKVTDAPSAASAMHDEVFAQRLNSLTEPDGSPKTGVARVVTSIEFQHPRYQGATFTWYQSRGCDNDTGVEYSVRNIKDHNSWWNDRISSFRGYSKCQVNHYEHTGFRGARTGYRSEMSTMGVMEDETSSLRWR
ncbi:hypothetical protein [Amycolatopsis aidingensis]|uniref:hypothetical protein n=1 Tax=Amycolatopsis aidingensis TaxID=2842453 RepID=UPI001C0D6F18|nr:hypothetical protein [Amycolatopsis aidingensis]